MREYTKSQIREWAESIIIAVVLALVIRAFIVQAFKIPSGSMIPTFQIGDRIFVSKFIYGAKVPFTKFRFPMVREPRRGDIVVFVSPESLKKDFVKRLIALPGERVEIKNGKVYIDDKPIDSVYDGISVHYYSMGEYGIEGNAVKVPEGSYFVLGDNSASSRDSRYWGFVPKDNVLGKVICIYWPLHRIKAVK